MKLNKLMSVGAASLALFAGAATAAPFTLTNSNGAFSPFSGFDWAAEGQGLISGYDITNTRPVGFSDSFTLKYQAHAATVNLGGVGISLPGLNSAYEYTIFATVQETATCTANFPGGGTCDQVALSVVTGDWAIYYDTTPDKNYPAGTGFTDGIKVLSGSFGASTIDQLVFAGQGPSNPGNNNLGAVLMGQVLTTNISFISPTMVGLDTTASTTLQFGTSRNAPVALRATPTTKFDGVAAGAFNNTNFSFQADANQSFVPEPSSVALVGLALAAAGGIARRRAKKA